MLVVSDRGGKIVRWVREMGEGQMERLCRGEVN